MATKVKETLTGTELHILEELDFSACEAYHNGESCSFEITHTVTTPHDGTRHICRNAALRNLAIMGGGYGCSLCANEGKYNFARHCWVVKSLTFEEDGLYT